MSASTQAHSRAFRPNDLATLPRETRQQLCRALLVEHGVRVGELIAAADHDDFSVQREMFWRMRAGLVRVVYRPVEDADVQRVAAIATDRRYADAVLIEASTAARSAPKNHPAVQVVRAPQLISRLEAAALVAWSDGVPQVDQRLFALVQQRSNIFDRVDVLGLRYLPWLSRNKTPSALTGSGQTADKLFEEYAFRLFTLAFRFGGRRLGATKPATAEPDALLFVPGTDAAVLLDCKAARDGYRMNASDYRALREYAQTTKRTLGREKRKLTHVVVVSSSFAGVTGLRHPHYGRSRKLVAEAKVRLSYIEADELVRFAITLEERGLAPASREAVGWSSIFDAGMPDESVFDGAIP